MVFGIYELAGLILVSLFAVLVVLTLRPVRKRFCQRRLKDEKKDFYEKHLHLIYLCRFIFMFFFPLAVALLITPLFGIEVSSELILNLLVMGLAMVTFSAVELPFLTKPNVFISLLPTENKSYREEHEFHICARADEKKLLMFRVVNTGFHMMKNTTAAFTFPQNFEILDTLDNSELYDKVDFKKDFRIQKQNNAVLFSPSNNIILAMVPQGVIVFPIWIKTPNEKGKGNVKFEIGSETTWGTSIVKITISVV